MKKIYRVIVFMGPDDKHVTDLMTYDEAAAWVTKHMRKGKDLFDVYNEETCMDESYGFSKYVKK